MEQVLVQTLVWGFGSGKRMPIGGMTTVVTVVVNETLIGEAGSSSSSDSWMMSLGHFVGF